jgi:hypothetical protein
MSEELGDLTLTELDVVYDGVVGWVQATQHPVEAKILHAGAGAEVLECLIERLERTVSTWSYG